MRLRRRSSTPLPLTFRAPSNSGHRGASRVVAVAEGGPPDPSPTPPPPHMRNILLVIELALARQPAPIDLSPCAGGVRPGGRWFALCIARLDACNDQLHVGSCRPPWPCLARHGRSLRARGHMCVYVWSAAVYPVSCKRSAHLASNLMTPAAAAVFAATIRPAAQLCVRSPARLLSCPDTGALSSISSKLVRWLHQLGAVNRPISRDGRMARAVCECRCTQDCCVFLLSCECLCVARGEGGVAMCSHAGPARRRPFDVARRRPFLVLLLTRNNYSCHVSSCQHLRMLSSRTHRAARWLMSWCREAPCKGRPHTAVQVGRRPVRAERVPTIGSITCHLTQTACRTACNVQRVLTGFAIACIHMKG